MSTQIPIKANFSGTKATSLAQFNSTDAVGIANGGTGQVDRQLAINALTNVAASNVGNVLTKDAAGNATWQIGGGGSTGNWQPLLISGQNIKTINGNTILGSGDLALGAGTTITNFQLTQTGAGSVTPVADSLLGVLRYGYNWVKNASDAYTISTATGRIHNLLIDDTIGVGASGGRDALMVGLNVANATSGTEQNHSAITGFVLGRANANTSQLYGINAYAGITASARVFMLTGLNVEIGAQAGSLVTWKAGIQITSNSEDKVSGTSGDGALAVTAEVGAVGWLRGIAFHNYGGANPIHPTNGVILGTIGAATCRGGIDFTSYTFFGGAALNVKYGSAAIGYGDINGLNPKAILGVTTAGILEIGRDLAAGKLFINVDGTLRQVYATGNDFQGLAPGSGFRALCIPNA